VLVVAEDVQWMDSASQAVLAIIADALRHRNALVCVTRHDTTDGFQTVAAPHVCTLAPAPLTDAEAAAALVAATEDAPLRPDEIATLASRAAGNPLFLSAVLAAAGTTSNVAALPDSVDAVLTAQVDRLPPTHQQLLRSASVLGRTFSRHELHAVVERDHAVIDDDMWTELSDFLTLTGSDTVAFRHGLLRDAVYEGLPFRRRRELHARAAEAIAARLGAHAETEAELLSLHCFHAQRFMDAWRFAGIAGARAFDKYANAEAAELLERAVASAKHTRGEVPDAEIAAVLEQLGDARDRAGIYDRALAAYHSARRLRIDDIAGQVALLVKEADIAQRTGHYRRVITIAKRGLRLLDRAEIEGGGTRARLKIWYAIVREFQGRVDEAATLCSEAVADAVAAGDLPAEAQSRLILDWIQVERGRHDLATHSPRALAIYEELGDVGGQALVLNNLGAFAYWEGRWTDAVALYEQGRAARLVTGNAVDAASGTMNIGEVYADQGRLDEAEQCFRDAWRVWRSVSHAGGSALTTMHLGRIAAKRGDFAEAFALLDAAREEFLAIGSTNDVLEVDTRTAECRILAGEYETALGVADRELAASHGLVEETALLRIRGTALLALGRADEGIAALRSCLDESRSRGARFEIALAQHELVDAYFARGDLASAEEAEREATAIFAELGVTRAPIRRARAAAYLPT
jgi:tetratricopeptide (TPR) repeat protein